MRKSIAAALIAIVAFGGAVILAQTTTTRPAFDVASIRPASPPTPETVRSGQFHQGSTIDGSHLDFGFVTLADLLPYAFRVKSYQISGPSWLRDGRWNILATLPAGSTPDQVPEMMQALLADRFKLAFHMEKREYQVYELQVAPGGPKVEVSTGGDFKVWDGSFPGFNFSGNGAMQRGGGLISGAIIDQPNCGQRWEFIPLSMDTFSYALSMFLNRPVVNETELKGAYKVTLDIDANTMFALNQNMGRFNGGPGGGGGGGPRGGGGGGGRGGPPPTATERGQAPAPPSGLGACLQTAAEEAAGTDGNISMLFQAVQKLGLKLQQGRAPLETIVVDHLEKTPTEN